VDSKVKSWPDGIVLVAQSPNARRVFGDAFVGEANELGERRADDRNGTTTLG
jgi:hypothetical protein